MSKNNIVNLIPDRILYKYFRFHPNWYSKESLKTEIEISKKLILEQENLYHFLYGENSFKLTGYVNLLIKKNFLVSTYHQTPFFFEKQRSVFSFIRTLDAVILISSNQVPFFESIIDARKINVIPHGVDTYFFHPVLNKPEHNNKRSILTVGSNYRDNETHLSIIKALNKTPIAKNLVFKIIGDANASIIFSGIDNVHYMSGITDQAMLNFYQNSDILLMPLKDATANNAILEGMACGLPIVTTDVGGIRDYLDETSAIFLPPNEVDGAVEIIRNILNDSSDARIMSMNARKIVEEKFSWEIIASQTSNLYRKLSA